MRSQIAVGVPWWGPTHTMGVCALTSSPRKNLTVTPTGKQYAFTFLVSIRESPAWRDMTRQGTHMLAHRQMARIYYYDIDQQYKINSAKYNLARRVGRGIALGLYSRLRVPLYFTPTVGIKYICSIRSTLYIIYVKYKLNEINLK